MNYQRVQNHPFAAVVLAAVVGIIALSQFADAVDRILARVYYDLCGGNFTTVLKPLRLRLRALLLENLLAARGKSPAAFDRR